MPDLKTVNSFVGEVHAFTQAELDDLNRQHAEADMAEDINGWPTEAEIDQAEEWGYWTGGDL